MLLEKYALALAITFGLLAVLGWLAAKYGQRIQQNTPTKPTLGNWLNALFISPKNTGQQTLSKTETVTLTPQHQLHKVRDGLRSYLIATHPGGTTVISSGLESKHNTDPHT